MPTTLPPALQMPAMLSSDPLGLAAVEITPSEVENLPLDSRDFVNLAILAPGARPVTPYDPTKARYGVFATNGSSGRNVNMTVNGVDNKDNSVGGP